MKSVGSTIHEDNLRVYNWLCYGHSKCGCLPVQEAHPSNNLVFCQQATPKSVVGVMQ